MQQVPSNKNDLPRISAPSAVFPVYRLRRAARKVPARHSSQLGAVHVPSDEPAGVNNCSKQRLGSEQGPVRGSLKNALPEDSVLLYQPTSMFMQRDLCERMSDRKQ
jgi:hypothetical protein